MSCLEDSKVMKKKLDQIGCSKFTFTFETF